VGGISCEKKRKNKFISDSRRQQESAKFIERDPHWYTRARRDNKVFQVRLHPNDMNKNSRIEIPEAWMPTIKFSNLSNWKEEA